MKHKSLKRVLLMIYLLVILYFMFAGFGRQTKFDTYQFSFQFHGIPLWFPKHFSMDIMKIWIFALGNLAAFMPLGILMPINLPDGVNMFWKSLAVFASGITILEFLQMVSLRGSFDLEDLFINTLGFSIGFLSWKIGNSRKRFREQVVLCCICSFICIVVSIMAAEVINNLIK